MECLEPGREPSKVLDIACGYMEGCARAWSRGRSSEAADLRLGLYMCTATTTPSLRRFSRTRQTNVCTLRLPTGRRRTRFERAALFKWSQDCQRWPPFSFWFVGTTSWQPTLAILVYIACTMIHKTCSPTLNELPIPTSPSPTPASYSPL